MEQRDIRNEQINNARRTIQRKPYQGQSGAAKKPFVAKGHDAVLKQFQDDGTTVNITMMSGDVITGVITGRDKYTITIAAKTDGSHNYVIYKHAIEYFYGTAKKE